MNTLDTSVATAPAIPLDRERILQATAQCLQERGYDGTTIRRIAGLLDCAVGSIYRYFRDKRELLFAVTQRTLEPAAEAVEAGGSLERAMTLYASCVAEDEASYRLMFWLASLRPGAVAESEGGRLPDVVQRIVAGWSQRLGDDERARAAWATLHGQIMLGRTTEQIQAAVRDCLDSPGHDHHVPHAALTPMIVATTPRSLEPRHAEPSTSELPSATESSDQVETRVTEDVCLL